MLKDFGINWTIIGHSERRHIFMESQSIIKEKIRTCLASGINVIYCIGETFAEREAGQTINILKEQMDGIDFDKEHVIIAYEPVWAIGTGKVATKDQIEQVHDQIRKWLNCNDTRIIYGGSVNQDNCAELCQISNVNGFLVGGASLKPTAFNSIILNSVNYYKH